MWGGFNDNFLTHFACLLTHFSSLRKQKACLITHFVYLLSHFSKLRICFGVFRKQKAKLLSQMAVCFLISVDRVFILVFSANKMANCFLISVDCAFLSRHRHVAKAIDDLPKLTQVDLIKKFLR